MIIQMQKRKALRRRGSIDDDLAMYIYNMSVSIILLCMIQTVNHLNLEPMGCL